MNKEVSGEYLQKRPLSADIPLKIYFRPPVRFHKRTGYYYRVIP